MTNQIGPTVTLRRSCSNCVFLDSKYHHSRNDAGYTYFCLKESVRRNIPNPTYTPSWCPVSPVDKPPITPEENVVTIIRNNLEWYPTSANTMTFAEAEAYIARLQNHKGGFSKWRLPSIRELISLVDYTSYNPASYLSDMKSGGYWSATTYAPNPQYAWVVNFDVGLQYANHRTLSYYVRAVRTLS